MTHKQLTTTERALTVAELDSLNSDLEKACDLFDALDDTNLLWSAEALAEYRARAGALPALRARWAAVDRPASADFIAGEIAKLAIAFPNSGGADRDLFVEVVADDVRAERPTCYALALAAAAYRRKYRFLGISDLMVELNQAKGKAARLRERITEFPLAERLKEIEADLPRFRRARQLIREDKRRRQARKAIWRYLESKGRSDRYWRIDDIPPDIT